MLKRRSLSRGYGEATTTTTLARMQATAVSETSLSPAYLSTCANRCVPAPSRRAVTHVYTKVHSEVFIRLPQAMCDLDYSVVAVLEVYGDHVHGIRVLQTVWLPARPGFSAVSTSPVPRLDFGDFRFLKNRQAVCPACWILI